MLDQLSENHETKVDAQPRSEYSIIDNISAATLTKLLIRKGLLSITEIMEEERRAKITEAIIEQKLNRHLQKDKQKFAGLKRWAAKKRWARRLTARLFGWEWKRAKHTSATPAGEI